MYEPQRLPDAGLATHLVQRVTVHQLRLLSAVVEHGGFSRAAEALSLSQPAISHQLKAMANAIGVPVLEVVGRRARLTQAGELLLGHARRILLEFETAGRELDELRGLRRGAIRIAGDTTVGIYVLPDLLGSFHEAHPEIDVRLGVDNRRGVYDRLVAGEVDFIVSGRKFENTAVPLVVRPLLANELIAVASPRNRLTGRRHLGLADLAGEPFIVREPGSGTRETTEEAFRAAGERVNAVMELASNGAIKRAVARDLGISILSRYAAALELQIGNLVELSVVGFPLHRQWHLVHARDKRLGPVEEAFLSFVDDGTWLQAIGRPVATE